MEKQDVDIETVVLRPDEVDRVKLKSLKKSGVKCICLDVGSTNDYILRKLKKEYDYKDIKRVSRLIKFRRLCLCFQMLVGLPESTRLDEMNTARDLAKLRPKTIIISPTIVTKENGLEKEYLDNEYTPLELGQAVEVCKELKQFFEKKRIKNVFIKNEKPSKMVAGPYHEKFKELVDTEYYYDVINERIRKINTKAKEIKITVNPEIASGVIGYERENIIKIKENYNLDVKIEHNWNYKLNKINVEITKTYKEFADDDENV